MWVHFSYKSGANPYIAITEKRANQLFRKYKGKIEKIQDDFYLVDDLPKETPLF